MENNKNIDLWEKLHGRTFPTDEKERASALEEAQHIADIAAMDLSKVYMPRLTHDEWQE